MERGQTLSILLSATRAEAEVSRHSASRYNIVERLDTPVGEYDHIILNSFSGSIDAVSRSVLGIYDALRLNRSGSRDYLAYFLRRGYFYRTAGAEAAKVAAVQQAQAKLDRSRLHPRLVVLLIFA